LKSSLEIGYNTGRMSDKILLFLEWDTIIEYGIHWSFSCSVSDCYLGNHSENGVPNYFKKWHLCGNECIISHNNFSEGKPHLDIWASASLLKNICPYRNSYTTAIISKTPPHLIWGICKVLFVLSCFPITILWIHFL
jgi:hypothetical protein